MGAMRMSQRNDDEMLCRPGETCVGELHVTVDLTSGHVVARCVDDTMTPEAEIARGQAIREVLREATAGGTLRASGRRTGHLDENPPQQVRQPRVGPMVSPTDSTGERYTVIRRWLAKLWHR